MMKPTRRVFVSSALAAGHFAMRGASGSTIHVEPADASRFGVDLSHADFPGNIIRYRIPECWFCGLLPFWPPPGDPIVPEAGPNLRYPFIVLGPHSTGFSQNWEQGPASSLTGHMELPGWWSCESIVKPERDHVLIRSSLTNRSKWDWVEVWAHFCANNDRAPDFRDVTGERTILFLKDGARTVDRTHRYEGVSGRKNCNTYLPVARGMLTNEYLYSTPISRDRVSSPLIIRQSADKQALFAVCFRHYYGLFYDCASENNCIHSEPYLGDLQAGETRTVDGHLYWLKGAIADVVNLARELDHAWVPA
jgi:hypothetical protein